MAEISILDKLKLVDIQLKEMSATVEEGNTSNPEPEWICTILKHNKDKLVIKANVEIKNKVWFDIKASFLISFNLISELSLQDVEKNIDDIMYFAAAKYSLLSGFISDMMYSFPMPIAPYIDKEHISLKSNK
jgi:hypothetical protein